MELFDYKDGRVHITPKALTLSPFKAIFDKDKTKTKEQSIKDFAFVYFYSNYRSPYASYIEDDRRMKEVCKAVYKDENHKVSQTVLDACVEYEKLQETVTMRLLKSAKKAANRIAEYFESTSTASSITEDEVTALTGNLQKLGKIVESISILEEKVRKEQTSNSKIRGRDTGPGMYED